MKISVRPSISIPLAMGLCIATAACASTIAEPNPSPFGVQLIATVVRMTHYDSVTIRIQNNGTTTVFLRGCGRTAYTRFEQQEGNRWIDVTGADYCNIVPADSVGLPLRFDVGQELQELRFLDAPGLYRWRVDVSATQDMNQALPAVSNSLSARISLPWP